MISRNATGSLSDGDLNKMNFSIWTRSMMVFKGWIPKLIDTRFSEFKQTGDAFTTELSELEDGEFTTTGEIYDIGRARLFGSLLFPSIFKSSG